MSADLLARLQITGDGSGGASAAAEVEKAMGSLTATTNAGTAAAKASSAAHGELAGATKLTTAQMMELAHITRSVADGMAVGISPVRLMAMEGGRLAQALGSGPGGVSGTLKAIAQQALPFVAWAAPLALVAAGVAVVGFSFVKGGEDARRFQNELTLTGNFAGLTAGSFEDMARRVAAATDTTVSGSRKAVEEVAATGEFSGKTVQLVAENVQTFAELSGKSAESIVKDFAGIKSGVVEWAVKHVQAYHDITFAQLKYVDELVKHGKAEEAVAVLMQDIHDNIQSRTVPAYGLLQNVLHETTKKATELWDAILGIGRPKTVEQQIADQASRVFALQQQMAAPNFEKYSTAAQRVGILQSLSQAQAGLQALNQQKATADAKAAADAKTAQSEEDKILAAFGPNKIPTKVDRAANDLKDLQAEIVALQQQAVALRDGATATDAWKIADAGRQAVEKSGLTHKKELTAAEQELADKIRASAEEVEKLKLANERVAKAVGLKDAAERDIRALQDQVAAAGLSGVALEDWRIKEAGLKVLQDLHIETLDQLAAADRKVVQSAIEAAEAKERQAIATDKAVKVGATLRDLGEQIEAEKARTAAVNGGVVAEVQYARTVAIRQALDKAGKDLTAEQTLAIIEQVDARFRLTAANDAGDFTKQQQRELDLLRLTTQEREVETRALQIQKDYLAAHVGMQGQILTLTDQELAARAKAQALAEQAAADDARAIGELRQHLRDAFVQTGKLSFDDIATYAEQKLREAVWNALLSRPFDILINAVIQGISGIGGAAGAGNALGAAGGAGGAGGGFNPLGAIMGLPASLAATSGSLNMAASTALLSAGAPTWAINIGGQVAGASPYAIVGNLLSNALGIKGYSNGLVQGVGDAIASTVGMAVAGPIGAIVATIGAHFLGGLFNKEPSNFTASADFSGDNITYGGDKPNDDTKKLIQTLAQGVLAGEKQLEGLGLKLNSTVTELAIGQRDPSKIHLSDGTTVTAAVGDPAAAAEAALKAVLDGATFIDDAEKNLVKSMEGAGKGFDDIVAALQGYAAAQGLSKSIADQILQFTDPQGYATSQLADQQKVRRDQVKAAADAGFITADQLTAINAQLTQLEGLELAKVMSQFVANTDDAAAAAKALADQQQALAEKQKAATDLQMSVQDQIMQIQNPDAFAIKKIYDDINAQRAQAQPLIDAGLLPASFMDQLTQLQNLKVADALKSMTSQVDQTAAAFQQARPQLLGWLDQVGLGPSSELSPAQQRQVALDAYNKQLGLARGGDANALSGLTGYADRLLSADRMATTNAQDRLALYRQVTGDVAGVAAQGAAANSNEAIVGMGSDMKVLVQASQKQLELALSAEAAGGSPVVISNLPSLQAVYGQALTDQTASLVAANDQTRVELGAKLDAAVAAINSLRGSAEGGLAAVADGVAGVGSALAGVVDVTSDLGKEQALTNTYMRQAVAR